MLGAHVFLAKALGFFRSVIEYALALLTERDLHRRGNPFADGNARFNFFTNRLDRTVRTQKTVRERLVLTKQAKQQMLCLDVRAAVLACLISGEENHPPRLFCVAFKHGSPTLSRTYCPAASLPNHGERQSGELFASWCQLSMLQNQNSIRPPGQLQILRCDHGSQMVRPV